MAVDIISGHVNHKVDFGGNFGIGIDRELPYRPTSQPTGGYQADVSIDAAIPVVSEVDDEAAHRRLYASVIIQALIDATNNGTTTQKKAERGQAIAWLTTEVGTTAQNFEEVCLAANVVPSRVRELFRKYDGPPLNLHVLTRMRNSILGGEPTND